MSPTTAPCQVLAQRQRGRHGDERDCVDADVAAKQASRHGPRERHEHDRRRDGPDGVSGFGLREDVQQPAAADRHEDAGGEQAVAHEDVGGLTTRTEHGALCATLSLTLPRARMP